PLCQCLHIAATENFSHGGLAHIISGFPNLLTISAAVTSNMSAYQSMFSCCSSHSMEYTSCPLASNALPIDLVPANKSNTFNLFNFNILLVSILVCAAKFARRDYFTFIKIHLFHPF